jgi:hypothetical protein
MSAPAAPEAPESAGLTPHLVGLFILIIVVEVATVAALYWFGRHFGPS